MIRPGPPWIPRNQCPGGLVLHVYAIDVSAGPFAHARLLLVRSLVDVMDAETHAQIDGDLVASMIVAGEEPIVLVVYDGDTGERLKPEGLAGG